jgi:hypothetical protein
MMAGQSLNFDTITVRYAGGESAALTATLTDALGTPASNANDAGTWQTQWTNVAISVNPATRALGTLVDGVLGQLPAGVTCTLVYAV